MYNYDVYKITFKVDSLENDNVQLEKLKMFKSEINKTLSYIDSFNIQVSFLIETLDDLCDIMKIAQKYQCVMVNCQYI